MTPIDPMTRHDRQFKRKLFVLYFADLYAAAVVVYEISFIFTLLVPNIFADLVFQEQHKLE